MKWRWLVFDYVDPQLNLSRAERRRVRRIVWNARNMPELRSLQPGRRLWFTKGTTFRWADLMIALIPAAVSMVIILPLFFWKPGPGWSIFPTILLQMTASWILLALVGRFGWKPRVHIALGQLGYDVCRRCGYWLRGLSDAEDRCPECGHARQEVSTRL